MIYRYLLPLVFSLVLFALVGCGGGNDPVNENKDRPKGWQIPPQKDK